MNLEEGSASIFNPARQEDFQIFFLTGKDLRNDQVVVVLKS
jgi:hypothetical protein